MSAGIVRHTKTSPCPVCRGHEAMARGRGTRCFGFTSGDGAFAHCTRPEMAGALQPDPSGFTYPHRMAGSCRCGAEHGDYTPVSIPRSPARSPMRSSTSTGNAHPTLGTPEITYDYGTFQVCRWGSGASKQIRQRRPDGPGRWFWDIGDVEPHLYRRDELLTADPGAIVFVLEGEKAADACRDRGLLATCSPMGAGKWRDAYAAGIAGMHVFVLPDNDDVGRRHAEQVAAALHGIAASVRIVTLPGLPEKGDAHDFFTTGGTREQLYEVALRAAAWAPPVGPDGAHPAGTEVVALRRENAELVEERTLIFAAFRNQHLKAQRLPLLSTINQVFEKISHGKDDAAGYVPILIEFKRKDGTAEGIAPNAGCGAKAAGDAIKQAAEWGFWDRPRPVPGVVYDPETGLSHYRSVVKLKPLGSKLDLYRKLAEFDPEHPVTWGGRRVTKVCPDHPDADIVRTTIDECGECGRELDRRERTITAEHLDRQDDRPESATDTLSVDRLLVGQDDGPNNVAAFPQPAQPPPCAEPDCSGVLRWDGPGIWACEACGAMTGYAIARELAGAAAGADG